MSYLAFNKQAGYADALIMNAFVRFMKLLDAGKLNPHFAHMPSSFTPQIMDELQIDLFIRPCEEVRNHWELHTGDLAHELEGVRQITWVEWHKQANKLAVEAFKAFGSARKIMELGAPVSITRKLSKAVNTGEDFLIPVYALSFYHAFDKIDYKFFIDEKSYHFFSRHVMSFVQYGEFDSYFDVQPSDYVLKPTFAEGVPICRDLSKYLDHYQYEPLDVI